MYTLLGTYCRSLGILVFSQVMLSWLLVVSTKHILNFIQVVSYSSTPHEHGKINRMNQHVHTLSATEINLVVCETILKYFVHDILLLRNANYIS